MTEATSQELNRPLRSPGEAANDRMLKALRDIICRSSDPTAVFIAERALADAEGLRKGEGRQASSICPCCKRDFPNGGTCHMGGCPMGGDF